MKAILNGHTNLEGRTQQYERMERITDALKTFCVDNSDSIQYCPWIDSKYCMRSCKYYKEIRK